MFGLSKKKTKLVGLDMGSSALKIVSGELKGQQFVVEDLVVVPMPARAIDDRGVQDVEVVKGVLAGALSQVSKGLAGASYAACLHGAGVFTRRIIMPKIPRKEIPEQVRWEAEQVFPQDLTQIILDHVLLGEAKQVPNAPPGTKGWELILVGVHRDDITLMKQIAEESGAKLGMVDVDAFAAGDFLENSLKAKTSEHLAYVDVGASATRVSVRYGGGTTFIRDFPVGGNAFTDAIASQLGLSFEDAESLKIQGSQGTFPEEASNALQNAFSEWRNELQQSEDAFMAQEANSVISKWLLYGGASLTPGFIDAVAAERFEDRIVLLPFAKFLKSGSGRVDADLMKAWAPRLVTAAGLATRVLE